MNKLKSLISSYSKKIVDDEQDEIREIENKIKEKEKRIKKQEEILQKKILQLYYKMLSYENLKLKYKNINENIEYKTKLTLSTIDDKNFDNIVNNKIEEITKILPKILRSCSYFADSNKFLEHVKNTIEYGKFIEFLFDNKNSIESIKKTNKNVIEFYISILNNRIIDYFNNYNNLYQKFKTETKSCETDNVSQPQSEVISLSDYITPKSKTETKSYEIDNFSVPQNSNFTTPTKPLKSVNPSPLPKKK